MTKLLDKLYEMKLKMATVPVNIFIIGTFLLLIIREFKNPLTETVLSILVTGAISIVTMLLSNKEPKHQEETPQTSEYDKLFPDEINVNLNNTNND